MQPDKITIEASSRQKLSMANTRLQKSQKFFSSRLYLVWVVLGFAIPGVIDGVLTGTSVAVVGGILWGGFIRVFLAHHAISSINLITHLFGDRAFQTSDRSRNNYWLAIPIKSLNEKYCPTTNMMQVKEIVKA
jgi:fatty-acid desaturase